jgi:Holliday junction resolvase
LFNYICIDLFIKIINFINDCKLNSYLEIEGDKANWDNIKSDLEDTLKKIININNDAKSTVNEMWNLFKNNLTKSINKNIPQIFNIIVLSTLFPD